MGRLGPSVSFGALCSASTFLSRRPHRSCFLAWSSRTPRRSTASSERLESCSSARLYVLALLLFLAWAWIARRGTQIMLKKEETLCLLFPRFSLVGSREIR